MKQIDLKQVVVKTPPARSGPAPLSPRARWRLDTDRASGVRTLGWQITAVASVIAVWEVVSVTGVVSSSEVPAPWRVADALRSLTGTSSFWSAVGDTMQHWVLGLALSCVIAIPVGLALGASDVIYRSCRFTIDFLRTIPPVSVIPLALLLYGATTKMVLVLVVFGATWPLLLQTMYGVHQVDPMAREMAASLRLRRRDRVFALVLPSAAPFVATGVRLAATFTLLLAIGAELIGGAAGIGAQITQAQTNSAIPDMYAYVVASAFLGLAINVFMVSAEHRALKWHPSQRSVVR